MACHQIDEARIVADLSTMIGGSEAAAVCGVHPWLSPYRLAALKRGLIARDDLSGVERVRWGTILEPVVAQEYAERTGRKVRVRRAVVRHPEHAYIGGHIDRWIVGDPRGRGVLEVKTTSERNAADWADEPPLHYQIQLQHYLMVTGARWGSLCALVGGQELRWLDVERNERFCDALLAREVDFWTRYVVGDEMPSTDDSEDCARAVAALHPRDDGSTVALGVEAMELDGELVAAKAERAELDRRIRGHETRLRELIGDATTAVLPDGTVYTLKSVHRDGYAVEATDYRQLRRKARKGE